MAKMDTIRYQEELETFINMLNDLRKTQPESGPEEVDYDTPK
jgi:hypothetical protein